MGGRLLCRLLSDESRTSLLTGSVHIPSKASQGGCAMPSVLELPHNDNSAVPLRGARSRVLADGPKQWGCLHTAVGGGSGTSSQDTMPHSEMTHSIKSQPNVVKDVLLLMEKMAQLADASLGTSDASRLKDMCAQSLPALRDLLEIRKADLLPKEVARLIIIFSKLNFSDELKIWILEEHGWTLVFLMEKFVDQMSELHCRDVGDVVFALGRYGLQVRKALGPKGHIDSLLTKVLEYTKALARDMTADDLSKVISGIANTKYRDEAYLLAMADHCRARLNEFRLEDLARVIWGLARLEVVYSDCRPFLDAVVPLILERRSECLLPEYVSDFVWAAHKMKWEGIDDMLSVMCKMADKAMDAFKGEQFAPLLLGLQKLRYYPGDGFLRRALGACALQLPAFTPAMLTTCLVAVADFGFHHQQFVDAARSYCLMLDKPLETKHFFDISWSFAILSCIDTDMFKWMAEQVGNLSKHHLDDMHRRQFYQCLLDVHILHPRIAESIRLSPEFEEDCQRSWSESLRWRKHTAQPVFDACSMVRKMGFTCTRSELIFGKRFAINAVRHRGLEQRFALELDVTFRNAPNRLLGPQIWRRRVLRALGWGILDLSQWKWAMMSRKDRDLYLQKKILHLLSEKKHGFAGIGNKPAGCSLRIGDSCQSVQEYSRKVHHSERGSERFGLPRGLEQG
eukprot:evm.model.scf_191.16 EVM.evm.TU.scf_191.16   scf_191:110164-113282(-)